MHNGKCKCIIFHLWLSPLVKYLFSYHSMKINPVFIEKTLVIIPMGDYRKDVLGFYTITNIFCRTFRHLCHVNHLNSCGERLTS